jgi:phage terminase large subunit-like protein
MWHEGVMMGLRGSGECRVPIGRTRVVVTTTPRPRKLIRELLGAADTHVTRGSTFDNAANLPGEYLEQLKSRYAGTRIGRQELDAEMLDDVPGALWTYASIDDHRVDEATAMVRVVVAIDPSGKSDDGDEQGIVVVGKGTDGHAYVLADRSTTDTPDGWGRRAVQAYVDFKADRIVGERNYGGEMVGFVVETAAKQMGVRIAYQDVVATRGKMVRAEPISALYEQGKVHHVGPFERLEEQMRGYVPDGGRSPDRMDALVWALTELMMGDPAASFGSAGFSGPKFTFNIGPDADEDD